MDKAQISGNNKSRALVSRSLRSWLLCGAASLGLGLATPVSAAPATEEGARQLEAKIRTNYIAGQLLDHGGLTISPHGDNYDFVVDANKMPQDVKGSQAPLPVLTIHVTPQDGGTYAFVSDPVSYSSTMPASDDMKSSGGAGENCATQGVFNPDASYLSSLTIGCDKITVRDRSEKNPVDFDIGKLSLSWAGTAADNGTANLDVSLDVPDIVASVPDDKTPGVSNHIKVGRFRYGFTVTQARAREIDDLRGLSGIVGGMAMPKPADDIMLNKLKAILPLWESLKLEMNIDDLKVETPEGVFTLGHYGEKQAITGIVKDTHYELGLDLSGIAFQAPGVPQEMASLAPSKASLDVKVAGVDLESVANTLMQGPAPAEEKFQEALMSLLIGGKASIAADLGVSSQTYDVQGHGEAPIDPKMQATGSVSASGFDAIMAALNKVKIKDANNFALGLTVIKGMAKTGPDGRLVWNLALDLPAKKISVNGQSFDLPEK